MTDARAWRGFAALSSLVGMFGCSSGRMPDAKAAADAYAKAAERADVDAIYAMSSRATQRRYGRAGVRALVRDERRELLQKARSVAAANAELVERAELRFADGETALLSVEAGKFRILSAGALPSAARSPAEALGELRQALARRSYPSLLRVLSDDKRSALESDLRSLVIGLEQPEALEVKVNGDTAEVTVPGGHLVKLKREAGVWRIDDFD
jgi:hypothetical protein